MSIQESILSVLEVREYLSDYPSENLLLDKEEFSDTFIRLSMDLAMEEFNSLSPPTAYTSATFPSKSLLLIGTLWKMFVGRCAVLARNHMSYSDGGLQIPIEERFQLYQALAADYGAQFATTANRLKISLNVDSGWSYVSSDYSNFPWW